MEFIERMPPAYTLHTVIHAMLTESIHGIFQAIPRLAINDVKSISATATHMPFGASALPVSSISGESDNRRFLSFVGGTGS